MITYPCATCGVTRGVRKLGAQPSGSGVGVDVYGCPAHASDLAAGLDDVLPNLEWLLSREGRRP